MAAYSAHMQGMRRENAFGLAVREARGAGISQQKLATLINVASSTIYRIERGETPSPRVERALRKWCATLPPLERSANAA